MKVALNLVGLPSTHQGGAGFYSATLARSLAARSDIELVVVAGATVGRELGDLAPAAELLEAPETPANGPVGKARRVAGTLRDPAAFLAQPGLDGGLDGCDVVHHPLGFAAGPDHDAVTVVTAVDLQHLAFPSFFTSTDRFLRRVVWHRSWRRADRLIAFSSYVRDAIGRRLDIDGERIDVVPASCHPAFFQDDGAPIAQPANATLLYPASPLPAKNHRRLVEAVAAVSRAHDDVELTLCGPTGHDWGPVLAAVEAAGVPDRVSLSGHMTLEALRAAYREVRGLIFPSLYEGFGIPVLEAMATGCLVGCSDTASLPELIGDAGVRFDPTSTAGIAAAIERMLTLAPEEHEELVASARARARRFDVTAMTDGTIATYARALESR